MSEYEERLIIEQEGRTLFDHPVRYTTIFTHPSKMTYDQFLEEIKSWGLQENLRSGEKFIEEWLDIFLAYNEIEHGYTIEKPYKNKVIDRVVKARMEYEKYKKNER